MNLQEIEAAIIRLPLQEVEELSAWLTEYHHKVWDQQIDQDASSGRLNSLLAEVDQEYTAGLARSR